MCPENSNLFIINILFSTILLRSHFLGRVLFLATIFFIERYCWEHELSYIQVKFWIPIIFLKIDHFYKHKFPYFLPLNWGLTNILFIWPQFTLIFLNLLFLRFDYLFPPKIVFHLVLLINLYFSCWTPLGVQHENWTTAVCFIHPKEKTKIPSL